MLTINNLSKSFGQNSVLKDFTYHFKPNKVYALMGANGSGKTTLFHLISGFLKADEGGATLSLVCFQKLDMFYVGYIKRERKI